MNHCICLNRFDYNIPHSWACRNQEAPSVRLTDDELRRLNYAEGTGDVVVTRLDGTQSNPFLGIRYDSNRIENGFLVMEDEEANVFHVANCDYWVVL